MVPLRADRQEAVLRYVVGFMVRAVAGSGQVLAEPVVVGAEERGDLLVAGRPWRWCREGPGLPRAFPCLCGGEPMGWDEHVRKVAGFAPFVRHGHLLSGSLPFVTPLSQQLHWPTGVQAADRLGRSPEIFAGAGGRFAATGSRAPCRPRSRWSRAPCRPRSRWSRAPCGPRRPAALPRVRQPRR